MEECRLPRPLAQIPLEKVSVHLPVVSEFRIARPLAKLNPSKACGPDEVPNWLLREYSKILAYPVCSIIDASLQEQRLPTIWKYANVSPLPKKKKVEDLKKDLRSISLTACLSIVAEDCVVHDYFKPAVLKVLDPNQYGAVPHLSTTQALIHMVHSWAPVTDGNNATIRTVLCDYRKAFDLIDHSILVDKLRKYVLPTRIINRKIDFLAGRSQRIKLARDVTPSGALSPLGSLRGQS